MEHDLSAISVASPLVKASEPANYRDSQGKLLGHIVRTFDANGLVIAEQQIAGAV